MKHTYITPETEVITAVEPLSALCVSNPEEPGEVPGATGQYEDEDDDEIIIVTAKSHSLWDDEPTSDTWDQW